MVGSQWLSDRRTFYVEASMGLNNDSSSSSLLVYFDYTEPYQLTAMIDGTQSVLELTTLTAATLSTQPTDICYYLVGM